MRRRWFSKKSSSPLRNAAILRSVRKRPRLSLAAWWKKGLVALGALLVALGVVAVWAYFDLQDDVRQRLKDVTPPGRVGGGAEEPYNVLLVGSDSRKGLTRQEQERLGARWVKGQRADTLILAHFDPANDRITMLQFPRDLFVPMPDGGRDRINNALEKGPNYLTRTVESLSGLEINRYAQVNIAGFRDIVDAIGGVSVCITQPIPFDEQTGLEITSEDLGLVHFNGTQALRFVRTRKTLPQGDFDRIRNQQRFLAAAIDKITSTSTFFNPNRIRKLKNHAGDNVVIDSGTSLRALMRLAGRFQNLTPKRYEAYTVPNLGERIVRGASVVAPDDAAMNLLFEAIEDNRSPNEADGVPAFAPSSIRVGVYNASQQPGAAAKAAKSLVSATLSGSGSVRIAEVATAPAPARNTVIRYRAPARGKAEVLAAVIPGARLQEGKTKRGVDVAVLVGKRFSTKRLVQLVPIPLPEPSALPPECRR